MAELSLAVSPGAVGTYREISDARRTKSQNLNVPRLIVQFSLPNSLKPGIKLRMDVVGAAPTGDAPTTSEWSTIVST